MDIPVRQENLNELTSQDQQYRQDRAPTECGWDDGIFDFLENAQVPI